MANLFDLTGKVSLEYAKLKETTRVLETKYVEDGISVRAILTPSLSKQLKNYIK